MDLILVQDNYSDKKRDEPTSILLKVYAAVTTAPQFEQFLSRIGSSSVMQYLQGIFRTFPLSLSLDNGLRGCRKVLLLTEEILCPNRFLTVGANILYSSYSVHDGDAFLPRNHALLDVPPDSSLRMLSSRDQSEAAFLVDYV